MVPTQNSFPGVKTFIFVKNFIKVLIEVKKLMGGAFYDVIEL